MKCWRAGRKKDGWKVNKKNVAKISFKNSLTQQESECLYRDTDFHRNTECREYTVMQKDNIVLIGMPGVGKSTVGVILAKVLGYQFIDADLVIQEQEKRLLREIIAEEGTEGFIQVENRVNATLEAHHAIIATGGSVVYGKEAMEHLQEIGTVIYLEVAYPELEKRLEDIKGRGVVLRDGQTLYDLYLERTPLYEKYADIRISETGLDIEQTVEQIVDGITNLH